MAYKVNPTGPVRDKIYPSQIAAERPMCAPRIHCQETPDLDATLRGGEQPMHTESQYERFHHELRSGHAFRNENDPDETGHRESTLHVEGDGY
jgi:hypothetical protein